MQFDRHISISAAGSRKATYWPVQSLYWSELVEKLRIPVRSTETLAQYLNLPKSQQDELKDVGGYVCGILSGNRRKANNVINRDVITLDLDNIPAGGTQDVLRRLEGLGCAYAVYSTRKHDENKPRLRVLAPVSRTASADEYEPLARKLASIIGIPLADPTTFESSRLMYWPSCCSDSQYVFQYADKPFLDTDRLLGMYSDWRNINEWPEVPGAANAHVRLAAKQGDPTEKQGIIGAFCRQYDIHAAIETFLSGVYTPSTDGDRYTFIGGSTVGGAIVYEHGLFLYSHHATDPCSGRLVNAFDLVRLHKYGEKDDEAKPDTPVNKLPSFTEMVAFARNDYRVKQQKLEDDFGSQARFQENSTEWIKELEEKPNGQGFKSTARNVKTILKNDPDLAGKFARDIFSQQDFLLGSVPWREIKKQQALDDSDDSGLRNFLSDQYGITGKSVISDAFSEILLSREFHPVRDYLDSLRWDGLPRVETLLIDYLGAEDTELTRAMTRKTLVGAVARVFHPGCKFDYVLTLIGKQGIGKSNLFDLLGAGWFTDSLKDIRSKDALEVIQGSWIIELAELSALRKAEVDAIKQFITIRVDKFRQSYAKRAKEFPRQCIFIATTNEDEPLKDQTGGRRWWTVPVGVHPVDFSKRDYFPRDQIWAEAAEMFKKGESLILPDYLEKQANELQKAYTEESALAGFIREHLDKPWGGGDFGNVKVHDRVCAMEIWCEMLGNDKDVFTSARAREINSVLKNTPGWRIYPKNNGRTRHGKYGIQTIYERVSDVSHQKSNLIQISDTG